ncbi:MAG: hypothetical protein DRJ05_02055 [Bacteroidetes bacterium]|nr:MAG: hypothetical protein DRJ05_02055 [Bacteroidota bacterium]
MEYLCAHCNGQLTLDECVIFSVKTSSGKRGLISLHSEIGNYSVKKHPDFHFKEGDQLEFFCPICHKELASERHNNLAKVVMIDDQNNEFEVLFSKVAGEKSTFKIVGETMETYGDNSSQYIDFVNLSMNF